MCRLTRLPALCPADAGAKEELNTVKKASRAEIATLAAELSELKQKMAAMKMASGSPN